MILIKILLMILLGLLLLPFLALTVPIHYQGRGHYAQDEKQGTASITWLWGLLRFTAFYRHPAPPALTLHLASFSFSLPWPGMKKKQKMNKRKIREQPVAKEGPPPEEPETIKTKTKAPLNVTIKSYVNRDMLHTVTAYLKQLLDKLQPNAFFLSIHFGLEDPFMTTQINSILMALWPLTHKCPVQLQPVFYESPLDITGNIHGKLIPITLLWTTLRFAFKKPIRAVWWPLLKHKISPKTNEK